MLHQITFQEEPARCLACGRVFSSVQELLRDQECERQGRTGAGEQDHTISSASQASSSRIAEATTEGAKARLLFIVARDNYRLYRYLTKQLSGVEGVLVVLEQRRAERRQQRMLAHSPRRRKGQRRRQPVYEDDLRSYGFVVIHQ